MRSLSSKATGELAVQERREFYPEISIDEKQVPELKGMKPGDKLMIHVEAKICRMNKRDGRPAEYGIELHKCDIVEEIKDGKEEGEDEES